MAAVSKRTPCRPFGRGTGLKPAQESESRMTAPCAALAGTASAIRYLQGQLEDIHDVFFAKQHNAVAGADVPASFQRASALRSN